jgi:HK97 family phage portal protein
MIFRNLISTIPDSDLLNPQQWVLDLFGGNPTSSGERVSGDTAFYNSNVYACASILGGDIGKLPIMLYKNKQGGREINRDHPVAQLLGVRPNPYMSAYTFKELMMVHMITWGNAYAYIEWDWNGFPKYIWPLNPALTDVRIDLTTGEIWYVTTLLTGEMRKMPFYDVIHLKAISRTGLKGLTPIAVIREEVGTQESLKKFIGSFYANGTSTRGVLKVPGLLKKEAKDVVRQEWMNANSGLTNAHKIAILDSGLDYQSIGMPLADAQFIDTMKMGVLDVAKIYKIPPHKLNQLDRATFSNIEQQSLDYVKSTLQPIITQWEQEFDYKLFTDSERKKFYSRFNVTSELRGDSQSRAAYYKDMTGIGAFSINDVLEFEDMDGIGEAGDKHRVDLNHISVEIADEYQLAKAKNGKGGDNGEGNGNPPANN